MSPSPRTRASHSPRVAGVTLWLAVSRAADALRTAALDHLRAHAIHPTDFGILEALLTKDGQPVNELGRKVLITSGSVTTAVDRLVKRGFVRRHADGDDRRVRTVWLTPQGRAFITPLFADHAHAMEKAAAPLTNDERRQLITALNKLRHQKRRPQEKES